jgi:hypothetical protein
MINQIFVITYTLFLPFMQVSPLVPQRGIFINPTYRLCSDLHTLGAEWYSDDEYPITGCDVEFVPRTKSISDEWQLDWALSNVEDGGWFLTLDEPNLWNVTPHDAAVYYRLIESKTLTRNIKLVAPVPSQHPSGYLDPLGYTWLWQWLAEYEALYSEPPRIDAFGWNIFEDTPGEITSYLIARRAEALARGYTDTPFWVTSYGGECWQQDGQDGNAAVIGLDAWFEEQEWIDRYAWFGTRISGSEAWAQGWQSCSLLDTTTGNRTALGELYR